MKTVYITLLIFAGFFAKSQQTELLENTWYISKVVLDGIDYNYYPPPGSNSEIPGPTYFYDDPDIGISSSFCNQTVGKLVYGSDNSFSVIVLLNLLDFDCEWDFEDKYFNVYGVGLAGNPISQNPFVYEIQDFGNNKVLTITNGGGDKAIYNSENLSVSDVSKALPAKIYPNPATDVINIASDKKIAEVSVFDASSKVVKTTTETAVNISNLAKGSYVVSIRYADGTAESRKVIKK